MSERRLEAANGTYWVFNGQNFEHYSFFTAIKCVVTKKYKNKIKWQSCPCLINRVPHHKDVWWSQGIVPPFLILAMDGGDWSPSCPSCFTPGERVPGTHLTGHCVSLRAGLDDVEERKLLFPAENKTLTPRSSSL